MTVVNTKNQYFVVWSNEIEGRFDPHFYKPKFRELTKKIRTLKYKTKQIKDLADVICGPFGSSIKVNDYKTSGIPLIRIANITKSQELTSDNTIFITKELAEKLKSYKVKKNDLIVSQRGTLGLVAKISDFFNGGIISANFIAMKDIKEVSSDYLKFFLSSKYGQEQLVRKTSGQVQTKITTDDIKSIIVPIPPLQTQNQIVEIMKSAYKQKAEKETEAEKLFNSIDDYILDELGIKIPETEDKMCFSVDSEGVANRLDSYYNQPKFKEVENAFKKGKYKTIEFGSVIKNINYGTIPKEYSNTGIPLLKIGNLKPNKIITDEVSFVPDYPEERDKQKTTKRGDLLISQLGTVGITAPVSEKEEGFLYGSFILRLQISQGNPMYFSVILNSPVGKIQFQRDMTTATVRANTSIPAVKSLKIPLPSLEIQNKIAGEVKDRIKETEKLKAEVKNIVENAKKKVEKIILAK